MKNIFSSHTEHHGYHGTTGKHYHQTIVVN